jgi:hypothetical protein
MGLERCEVVRTRGEDSKFGLNADMKRPGWRWGKKGKCYTYNPNDERSEKRARLRAKQDAQATRSTSPEIDYKGN